MRARHKKKSDAGLAVAVLVLAAILVGLVYAFWDKIRSVVERPTETVVEKAPPTPPAPPVVEPVKVKKPEPVVEKPPPPPPVKPKPVVVDTWKKDAADLHRKGEAALRALNFDLAAELFGKEAGLLGRDPPSAARARALCAKVEVFGMVTADVELNPEANGDLVTLKRHSGVDVADVVLVKETRESYVVKMKNGITVELPRDEVYAVERASPEQKRARLMKTFEKVERKNRGTSGVDHYLVAEYAYKDGLKEKTLEYLEKAYRRDSDRLPKKVRIHRGKKLLGIAIWFASTGRTAQVPRWCRRVEREFSDVPELVAEARELREKMLKPVAVANYKSTVKIRTRRKRLAVRRQSGRPRPPGPASAPLPEAEEVTVVADKVRSRSGRNANLIREINAHFEKAMKHYVDGRPGNPNSNMHLSKAAQLFDEVIQLCDQALGNDPGNAQLQSRQADASRYGYHARKMKTLGLFGG